MAEQADKTDPPAPAAGGAGVEDGAAGSTSVDAATFLTDEPAPATAVVAETKHADDDLRAAVGVQPARTRARTAAATPRRGLWWIALAAVAVLVGAAVIAGYVNRGRYAVSCGAAHIAAEQGRGFPPWGLRPMSGSALRPIPIPPEVECVSRETDSREELETWFLEALVAQATARLTGRDVVPATDVDAADALLVQALLLTRAPERREQRQELERLRGDVAYWRAVARVRQAADLLDQASDGFEQAAAQRPRHAEDARARAEQAQRAALQLRRGPVAEAAPGAAAPGAGTVSGTVSGTGTGTDAGTGAEPGPTLGPPTPVAPAPTTPLPAEAPPPDAGMPSGGVLL